MLTFLVDLWIIVGVRSTGMMVVDEALREVDTDGVPVNGGIFWELLTAFERPLVIESIENDFRPVDAFATGISSKSLTLFMAVAQ